MFEIELDSLAQTINLAFYWKLGFPSSSQSVSILKSWWKSNPKIRQCVKYLQTIKSVYYLQGPNFKSNRTWLMG